MQEIIDISFGVGTLAALFFYIEIIVHRHKAILPHRWMLQAAVLLWALVLPIKFYYLDYTLESADAVFHLMEADEIAAGIAVGDWTSAWDHLGLSNRGFQLVLGLLRSVASPSQYFLRIAFAAIAFSGSLSLLELMVVATGAVRMPLLPVAVTLLIPSVIYWTPEVLKEAGTFWGCCMMLRLGCRNASVETKLGRWQSLVGMVVVGFLRPQWLAMWLAAFAATSLIISRRWIHALLFAGSLYPTWMLLQVVAPNQFEKAQADGMLSARQSQFEIATLSVDSAGGSTLRYYFGGPIPLVTGAALILFRPFPFEVHNFNELVSGAEVWFLSLVMLDNLRRQPKISLFLHQPGIGFCVLLITIFCWDFTYMYNLGLAVRQRLVVIPALLLLAFVPQIIRANVTWAMLRHHQGRPDRCDPAVLRRRTPNPSGAVISRIGRTSRVGR